jgi:hypothetical protein
MNLSDDEIISISQREFWNIIETIKERNIPPVLEVLETESSKAPTETTMSRQEAT